MTQVRAAILLVTALVFVGLLAGVFWFRGEAVKAKADRDKWQAAAQTYAQANETNLATIERYKSARAANDTLAANLAAELAAIEARRAGTRAAVREAYADDPQASSWASTPVPGNVRDAATGRRNPVPR